MTLTPAPKGDGFFYVFVGGDAAVVPTPTHYAERVPSGNQLSSKMVMDLSAAGTYTLAFQSATSTSAPATSVTLELLPYAVLNTEITTTTAAGSWSYLALEITEEMLACQNEAALVVNIKCGPGTDNDARCGTGYIRVYANLDTIPNYYGEAPEPAADRGWSYSNNMQPDRNYGQAVDGYTIEMESAGQDQVATGTWFFGINCIQGSCISIFSVVAICCSPDSSDCTADQYQSTTSCACTSLTVCADDEFESKEPTVSTDRECNKSPGDEEPPCASCSGDCCGNCFAETECPEDTCEWVTEAGEGQCQKKSGDNQNDQNDCIVADWALRQTENTNGRASGDCSAMCLADGGGGDPTNCEEFEANVAAQDEACKELCPACALAAWRGEFCEQENAGNGNQNQGEDQPCASGCSGDCCASCSGEGGVQCAETDGCEYDGTECNKSPGDEEPPCASCSGDCCGNCFAETECPEDNCEWVTEAGEGQCQKRSFDLVELCAICSDQPEGVGVSQACFDAVASMPSRPESCNGVGGASGVSEDCKRVIGGDVCSDDNPDPCASGCSGDCCASCSGEGGVQCAETNGCEYDGTEWTDGTTECKRRPTTDGHHEDGCATACADTGGEGVQEFCDVAPAPDGPGRIGAVKRPLRFPMEIVFVRGFCLGAQGA
jgi:hypothetical protein